MNPLSIIMFTTSACTYCKPMKIYLDEFQEQYGDKLVTVIREVDTNPKDMEIAREWHITNVPTILLLANGEEIGKVMGSMPKERLGELIEGCLQSDIFQESPRGREETGSPVLRDSSESSERSEGSDQNRNRPGIEL